MTTSVGGKSAIVTGAASGNGRAIALALAAAGAGVVCADRQAEAAQETVQMIEAAGGLAWACAMDVTRAADCERTAALAQQRLGGIDFLVNNAGILVRGGVLDLSEEDWDRQYAVNVKGGFLMTRAAAPALTQRKGAIVMVSSVAGLRGAAGHLAYSSSKHAVIGMMRCLALELGPQGVRVNAVCPGLVRTPMIADQTSQLPARVAAYPLGRIGEPEDVAKVVLHLLSPEAAWTTGLAYALDGGTGLGARA